MVCLFYMILAGTARSQISISGTVLDRRSKAAVADAKVSLPRLNLSATTDAAGKFAITGTSLQEKLF